MPMACRMYILLFFIILNFYSILFPDCGGIIDLSSGTQRNGTLYSLQYSFNVTKRMAEHCAWLLRNREENSTLDFIVYDFNGSERQACWRTKISIEGQMGENSRFLTKSSFSCRVHVLTLRGNRA